MWVYVFPKDVPLVWDLVSGGIRRGLAKGCGDSINEEWLLDRLTSGAIQLWVRSEDGGEVSGSIILHVTERERGRAIEVIMTSGKWWNDGLAMKALKDYAKQIGAYSIEAIVRNGLVPRLKTGGWRQKAVVMDVEI